MSQTRLRQRLLTTALVLTLSGLSFVYGILVHRHNLFPYSILRSLHRQATDPPSPEEPERRFGMWEEAEEEPSAAVDDDRREAIASLGYLSGYELASERLGVAVLRREAVSPGLNLFVSGHAPGAWLMDVDGQIVHEWRCAFEDAFPETPAKELRHPGTHYFRRVHLLPDGGLLVVFDYHALVRIDRDSRIVWAVRGGFHHDVTLVGDKIYALSEKHKIIPRLHPTRRIREDFIITLDTEGNVLHEISLLRALEVSSYASFLDKRDPHGDIFHTNTLRVLDGAHAHRSAVFGRGNLLVSFRSLNLIAIVDPREEMVVWALSGRWIQQHEPILLESGNMLLLDNLGHFGWSKVIEFDPMSQEIVWAYEGDERNGFLTKGQGTAQRLPNGNTLVTESFRGRAFELTPDKEIVWQFDNPARTGDDDELVAVLPEVLRLTPADAEGWLPSEATEPGSRDPR